MDEKELKKLAQLSRIEVGESELKGLQKDMGSILEYVSRIKEAPHTAPKDGEESLRNVFRDDTAPHESGAYTEDIVREVPKTSDGFVRVKKIL
ncbi:MAG: Asp-tRNA(Asn)/Glu-tRNA(Gln) amidotransferase subunit GatC [Patescibacteria group bacterium]